tara:strand:+ start:92 stop:409 length:318 start_codon:yes stop_codon:yes gene_type:complete
MRIRRLISAVALLFVFSVQESYAQVAAYDRNNQRDIYIIAITDSESLSIGAHLVINFPDTGESQTVEIVDVRSMGQDIELDLYLARQNRHYIVEVARDGISTLFR